MFENKIKILYEDKRVLVIDKPAGVVVNRADSVVGQTVQDWVEANLAIKDQSDQLFRQRSGIAHRIDKETSGCLVIAKIPEVLIDLLAQFKTRTIHKEYTALLHGRLEPKAGWWRWPIKRGEGKNREEFQVKIEGKAAETIYQIENYYLWNGGGDYDSIYRSGFSLVTLRPKTGRTHQIRVQADFVGHPLVGESRYGSEKWRKADKAWCPRHFLHSSSIEFQLTQSGKRLKVEAPIPAELRVVLSRYLREESLVNA